MLGEDPVLLDRIRAVLPSLTAVLNDPQVKAALARYEAGVPQQQVA